MYKVHSYTGWDFYFNEKENAKEAFIKWVKACREKYRETTGEKVTEEDKIFYEKMDNWYKEVINDGKNISDLNGNTFEKIETQD